MNVNLVTTYKIFNAKMKIIITYYIPAPLWTNLQRKLGALFMAVWAGPMLQE